MSEPTISVIIPCYNGSAYVEPCIRSVLEQKVNSEIIFVDDGSTDDSLERARAFMRQYPKLMTIICQANQGPAAARNNALRSARGKYVCFLDVDDQYAPGFFTTAMRILDGDASIAAVSCQFEYVNAHRPVEPWQKESMEASAPGNMLIRTDAARQIGGFPEDPAFRGKSAGEDIAFRGELAQVGRVVKLNQPLFKYLVRPGSHFDYFLDRVTLTDGKMDMRYLSQEEMNGTMAEARRRYAQDATRRRIVRLTESLHVALTAAVDFITNWARFERVPGPLHPVEDFAMYWTARRWPGDAPVAVAGGAIAPRTACWLAAACEARNQGKVVLLGPNLQGSADVVNVAQQNGLAPWIGVQENASNPAASPGWREAIRLLVLTGEQSFDAVTKTFLEWSRFVQEDGLIVLHNLQPPSGATALYDQLVKDGQHWKELIRVNTIGVVQKLA